MSNISGDLTERLIAIRDYFNYNNTEFAKICGFSSSAMDSLLKGANKDTKTTYVGNISTKLGVNLNWLINGEGEMFKEGMKGNNHNIISNSNSKTKGDIIQSQGGYNSKGRENEKDFSNEVEMLRQENIFLKKQLEFVNSLLDKAMNK